MDAPRFDSLTRLLGRGRSRRTMARGIAAAALGLAAGGGLAGGAAARECAEIDRRCTRDRDCCSGVCRRGSCACLDGGSNCGGVTPRLLVSAARFFGVDRSEIVVFSAETVGWPDSCLGCAGSDGICADVVTPGYRVVVGIEGNVRRLVYHTKRRTDEFVLCHSAEGQCPDGREACGRSCCQAWKVHKGHSLGRRTRREAGCRGAGVGIAKSGVGRGMGGGARSTWNVVRRVAAVGVVVGGERHGRRRRRSGIGWVPSGSGTSLWRGGDDGFLVTSE